MHFVAPVWLLLLIVIAAVSGVYALLQLRRKKYVARFSNVELLASVAPRRPGWRRHLTFALLMIGLTVLTIGAAQPTAAVKVPRDRATVMIAIDVSLSMKATDVLPSRMDAARAGARSFVDMLPPRINVGLVKFGGNASVVVPPTIDRDAGRLDNVHFYSMPHKPARQPEARPPSLIDSDHALDTAAHGGGTGPISGNGHQQCLSSWVDRAPRLRMRKARHLRRKHPTFVTHFNREDERLLIVHSGRHQSGDCLRHQKILQFGMAGSLSCSRHLHRICLRGALGRWP